MNIDLSVPVWDWAPYGVKSFGNNHRSSGLWLHWHNKEHWGKDFFFLTQSTEVVVQQVVYFFFLYFYLFALPFLRHYFISNSSIRAGLFFFFLMNLCISSAVLLQAPKSWRKKANYTGAPSSLWEGRIKKITNIPR